GNTLEGNRRGITLYHNATSEVAVVGNTLTNSGSIDFTPLQQNEGRQQFVPMYNSQILNNTVANTDRTNGVFIGVHSVQHIQTRTFGTSVIGLEMRGNSLTAGQPNVPAVVDADYPEGYFNYLEYHQMSVYQDERIPAVLGTIFESNRANNCANGLYLNTGSYNTVVCDLQLVNSGGMKDSPLDNISHGAVGTGGCSPITQPVSAPVATVSLNWVTSPAGLQVSINGQVRTTPYSQTFVVGSTVSLNVPTPQTSNGASFIYSNGSLGTSLTVPSANTTYTASFLSTAASVVVAPIVSGAVYSIIAKHSGKALSVYSSSKDDGGGIVQWSADGSVDQKWVLTKLSNGYYSIKSVVNSKAMDVYNNSTSDGAPVLQWTPNTQDNQQYKLVDAGGGYYSLVARHSQKYLAIEGSSQNEGAWLQQWPGSGDDNQKFRFTPQGSGRLEALRNEESGFEPSVAVYPNPGVDRVRVSGTGGGAVRLVDVQGRFQLEVASVGDVAEMDVSGLSPGVYLVQIHRGERLISRKLIVNH
ncbi:RICIN domain-containing protein, partial [Spirosoma utsteinense]|uniref:RICIN domain-containing protein n=1 Tax=Spirosoma utsteinense TaxID=2585773 RepID=UPI0016482604